MEINLITAGTKWVHETRVPTVQIIDVGRAATLALLAYGLDTRASYHRLPARR